VSFGAILKSDSAAKRGFPCSARFGCLGSSGRTGIVIDLLVLPKREMALEQSNLP
jgi:hypothetical protein